MTTLAYSSLVSIVDLFERISAYGGCVVASAQGYEGLGPQAKRIIETAATSILHQCVLPAQLIEAAGTRLVPDLAAHLSEDEEEGSHSEDQQERTTVRLREEPRVHPNEVQQLPVGQHIFISGGLAQKVQVARIMLDEGQVTQLETDLYQGYEHTQHAYEEAQVRQHAAHQPTPAARTPAGQPQGTASGVAGSLVPAPLDADATPAASGPPLASAPIIQVRALKDIV